MAAAAMLNFTGSRNGRKMLVRRFLELRSLPAYQIRFKNM